MGFTFLFASEADLESRAVLSNCCRGPEKKKFADHNGAETNSEGVHVRSGFC